MGDVLGDAAEAVEAHDVGRERTSKRASCGPRLSPDGAVTLG